MQHSTTSCNIVEASPAVSVCCSCQPSGIEKLLMERFPDGATESEIREYLQVNMARRPFRSALLASFASPVGLADVIS
jgi:hypothetical protein